MAEWLRLWATDKMVESSSPMCCQATTVWPLSKALNPLCPETVVSWLTQRSDSSLGKSWDRRRKYFSSTVLVYDNKLFLFLNSFFFVKPPLERIKALSVMLNKYGDTVNGSWSTPPCRIFQAPLYT